MGTGARILIPMDPMTATITTTTITRTAPLTPMTTDGLLTLSQWLSPAFPVSGFAYSGGLETAVSTGQITDAQGVLDWCKVSLEAGSARNDAILLSCALRGVVSEAELSATAQALAGSEERWRETRDQGRAFAQTLHQMGHPAPEPAAYPVALGRSVRPLGLMPELVLGLFLQAQMANVTSAAIRLVPLGQAAAQGVIAALAPVVEATASFAATAGPEELGGAAFGADLAAMAHETLEVRLFRS